MLDILLPTYKRPDVLQEVATNIEKVTKTPFTLYFGLEKDDKEGIQAAKKTGHEVVVNKYDPSYSNTAQTIYENSNAEYIFYANDDFVFLEGWELAPIKMLENPELMVIGCHDGNPDTRYWTISMIRRQYIQERSGVVDIPNRLFYPYHHNYIDTEFTETAIKRGVWRPCYQKCIEHHHPSLAEIYGEDQKSDVTYTKNISRFADDTHTYNSRHHLFT